MYFSRAIALLLSSSAVLAIPIPQGAGVGAGCDAILSDADTGSGLAVKEAGQNAAALLKSSGVHSKRQGAGVGAACNSILTDADTGSGLAVKEAGQNAASLLKSTIPSTGSVPAVPKIGRRQLDKAGAGVAAIVSLAAPQLASAQEGATNSLDGYGTDESAIIGQKIGASIAQTGIAAGNLVPSSGPQVGGHSRRQLDKAGAGTAALISLVNPQLANAQEGETNSLDGYGTDESAIIGQKIGADIAANGIAAGNLVPSSGPTGKGSN